MLNLISYDLFLIYLKKNIYVLPPLQNLNKVSQTKLIKVSQASITHFCLYLYIFFPLLEEKTNKRTTPLKKHN